MKTGKILPNTFLIGAQKAATTSLYHWLAQHPEVCGPMGVKDYPFFVREDYYKKGIELLAPAYQEEGYKDQKIVLQGCVQYMFYEEAIRRIYQFNSESKLIVVLRNPVDRAISAYKYFSKMQLEKEFFSKAISLENERLRSDDINILSGLTYVSHGKYGEQLARILEHFRRDQLLILFYDDLKSNPEKVIEEAYRFLGVSTEFMPNLDILNKTGQIRFSALQRMIFGKSSIRKALVSLIDPLFPIHKRHQLRLKIKEWNTSKKGETNIHISEAQKEQLKEQFIDDIELVQKITGRELNEWK